jgi:hypothetical protein
MPGEAPREAGRDSPTIRSQLRRVRIAAEWPGRVGSGGMHGRSKDAILSLPATCLLTFVAKPFTYAPWEFSCSPDCGVDPLNDVAAMGRAWHLEAMACQRMKAHARLVSTRRRPRAHPRGYGAHSPEAAPRRAHPHATHRGGGLPAYRRADRESALAQGTDRPLHAAAPRAVGFDWICLARGGGSRTSGSPTRSIVPTSMPASPSPSGVPSAPTRRSAPASAV